MAGDEGGYHFLLYSLLRRGPMFHVGPKRVAPSARFFVSFQQREPRLRRLAGRTREANSAKLTCACLVSEVVNMPLYN